MYQTFHLPQNPTREYQRRGGVWYYRTVGTNDIFLPVADKNQNFMESYFSKRYGFLFQYSTKAKIGGVVLLAVGIYAVIKLKKRGFPKL